MRQHHPETRLEYFLHRHRQGTAEVDEFLGRLEGFLGNPILRLNPDRDFDFWLRQYNNFLPSPQSRWCTRQMKLRPFETWIRRALDAGTRVFSYVAIRADEDYREGYTSKFDNLTVRLPFKTAGVDKARVLDILDAAGLGLSESTILGARVQDARLLLSAENRMGEADDEHPEAFEEAKRYEKTAVSHGSPFTWSEGESLEELSNRASREDRGGPTDLGSRGCEPKCNRTLSAKASLST